MALRRRVTQVSPLEKRALPALTPRDFHDFFLAAHGVTPFDWQVRLAREVAARGVWPQDLVIPSAAGKSGLVDIAVFELARQAEHGERRHAPLRIVHVLDRRVVANALLEHARRLAKALAAAHREQDDTTPLSRVAQRLVYLSDTTQPLVVRVLEAGAPHEGDWTPSAQQPTVLCSTVSQIGSRLLFCGSGLSASMRSVHAGLLGGDCLFLLEDGHFSAAFLQTLAAVDDYRRPPWRKVVCAPWMFATLHLQRCAARDAFTLRATERADEKLAPRLRAAKPVMLFTSNARSSSIADHATALVEHAWSCAGIARGARGRNVALVVNSIALARACHWILQTKLGTAPTAQSVLLLGRNRPLARDKLLRSLGTRLVTGAAATDPILFVVTTQAIEAGPDFDLDVLVTQLAPLDVLRQRFGRLNRRGRTHDATGVVLACRDELRDTAVDVIYGAASKRTWEWLLQNLDDDPFLHNAPLRPGLRGRGSIGTVDFGPLALDAKLRNLTSADLAGLCCLQRLAPTLMPMYLDLWSQTSITPNALPEVELFLYGEPDAGEVNVIWRADVQLNSPAEQEQTRAALALIPPRPQEAIAVPIVAVRAWLRQVPSPSVADLEGAPLARATERFRSEHLSAGRPVLRLAGVADRSPRRVFAPQLQGGDLIVVPSAYGGADSAGWLPLSREQRFRPTAVVDVHANIVALEERNSCAFELHRDLLERLLVRAHPHSDARRDADRIWKTLLDTLAKLHDDIDGARLARTISRVPDLPPSWVRRLRRFANSHGVSVTRPQRKHDALVLVDLNPPNDVLDGMVPTDPSTTETDWPTFTATPLGLRNYTQRFTRRVERAAALVSFPRHAAADLTLAAALAPTGMRDERYQALLRGGDRLAKALGLPLLASPAALFKDASAAELARERAQLPKNWRFEAESVRRTYNHSRLKGARDKRLALWMIGTHRGHGRPLYPHADPQFAGPQDLDFQIDGEDWPQIFAALKQRYGWWGLAHLEALFRLCEHRVWRI